MHKASGNGAKLVEAECSQDVPHTHTHSAPLYQRGRGLGNEETLALINNNDTNLRHNHCPSGMRSVLSGSSALSHSQEEDGHGEGEHGRGGAGRGVTVVHRGRVLSWNRANGTLSVSVASACTEKPNVESVARVTLYQTASPNVEQVFRTRKRCLCCLQTRVEFSRFAPCQRIGAR